MHNHREFKCTTDGRVSGVLEARALTCAATAAGPGVGVGSLRGRPQRKAAAVQVQSVCHVGQTPQARKLAVHLLHLTLNLQQS